MAEEIREVLNLLNEKLAGLFPYRLEMVTPGELKLLEKNARYMKAEQFRSLVENIKKDGNLSSLPLCYREKDGKLRVLSGNHRVQAGRQAGVEQVLVMVVGDEKDSDERLAIQLSHNAIAGQDDLVILKDLWESIQNVQAKLYAGLDSETIKSLEGIQFAAIAEQRLNYKMANFVFLPEEIESLDELLKETAVAFSADVVYLANLDTYDAFFDLVVKVKKKCVVKNSAAAFLKLMELARIGLEKLKEEEALQDGEGPSRRRVMGWHEALLPYRASDDPQGFLGAALLAQDQQLFRLAATWPLVKRFFHPLLFLEGGIDLDQVWEQTIIDFADWADLAQLPPLAVVLGFRTLKGARVVFPDGSLSHQAESVIKRGAATAFMAATGISGKDLR